MESIIIGGGKIGYNLLKTLREKNYQVMLIEKDQATCMKIADELDADVIYGDGTDLEILREAGIEGAEIVAAVTGTDEGNMVICQIAMTNFNVKKTIARVNNPKNIALFKALGISRIVCSTAVIADMIEYELDREDYHVIQTFDHGAMVLVEISISIEHPWRNIKIADIPLPKKCIIISVVHEEEVIYPTGDTLISEDDKVLLIIHHSILKDLIHDLHKGDNNHAAKKANKITKL
ncbi:MAG: TrkA family potassium uptake protein [Clostridia bacterium]